MKGPIIFWHLMPFSHPFQLKKLPIYIYNLVLLFTYRKTYPGCNSKITFVHMYFHYINFVVCLFHSMEQRDNSALSRVTQK